MKRIVISVALALAVIFTLMPPVFAKPVQEAQEGVLKDGEAYIAADQLVKYTSGTGTGTKISANKSYNEIKLDGEVIGHFTFNKDASALSITIAFMNAFHCFSPIYPYGLSSCR